MSVDRIAALTALLEQDPNSTFARYGLAQALASAGRLEEAAAEYRTLAERQPAYVATYFHYGQTLERLGRVEEARQVYQRGMEVAAEAGDLHTRDELQGVLDMLPL